MLGAEEDQRQLLAVLVEIAFQQLCLVALIDEMNRLRDLVIADDGKTIYLVTDSGGGVLDVDGEGVGELENPGAILVYTAK